MSSWRSAHHLPGERSSTHRSPTGACHRSPNGRSTSPAPGTARCRSIRPRTQPGRADRVERHAARVAARRRRVGDRGRQHHGRRPGPHQPDHRHLRGCPVGTSPAQVAVSADGKYAYTGISDPASIEKVDLAQRKVVGSAAVPNPPVQLCLTPDGSQVVSADQGRKERRPGPHPVGHRHQRHVHPRDRDNWRRATASSSTPPGDWAWVTKSYDNTVTVDLASLTAMTPIVGTQPAASVFAPKSPPRCRPASRARRFPPSVPTQTSQPGRHAGHH